MVFSEPGYPIIILQKGDKLIFNEKNVLELISEESIVIKKKDFEEALKPDKLVAEHIKTFQVEKGNMLIVVMSGDYVSHDGAVQVQKVLEEAGLDIAIIWLENGKPIEGINFIGASKKEEKKNG